ncbi:MAG TPA: Na+/H+ antiporter subunit E [Burkholderiales bacterium]|nr:Na+/H+ antiporter subunit E [Burkholderiales bacterium]
MKLSLVLFALWLVLQQSLAVSDVLIGIAIAAAASLAYARLQPSQTRPRFRPRAALELFALLIDDVVRSNFAVARIVLGLRGGKRTAGFLTLPLELRDPRGLAILACVVTATPGTSWAGYDAAANAVTIHVLDLTDEAAWIRDFKARYEGRLLKIFP